MSQARPPLLRRLLLSAGVAGVAVVHFDDHPRPDMTEVLLDRTTAAMSRAGFAIVRHREGWAGTRATGRRTLEARHPACALPVTLEAMGALNPRAGNAIYIYGEASGPAPNLVTFAGNALAMAWNHAMPWRETPRPNIKMLAAYDPSACLAITATDWRWIWFGPGRSADSSSH